MAVFAADVAVLLAEPAPALGPPSRWKPVTSLAFEWGPSVLVIGQPLSKKDLQALERAGGAVEHCGTVEEALTRMAEAARDVVVVSAAIADETDGLRFVRAFKCAPALIGASASLEQLRRRYRRTPFVVPPLAGDSQFAVFESATRWFLGNTWAVPLPEAILGIAHRRS